MSPTELDVPLLPSADQVRRREFATIRRGYDPEQVRDYLQQIATQIETLEAELREARLQLANAHDVVDVSEPPPEQPPQEDPYEQLAKRIAELIRAADTEAERIVSDAKAEASRSMTEARTEADRIRVDAQSHAEDARQEGNEILQNARLESERVLSGLSARRETLVNQLHDMQTKLLGVARDLETAIDDRDAPKLPMPPGRTPDEPPVDTRYEDLWMGVETSALNLEDLGPIELGFEDDTD